MDFLQKNNICHTNDNQFQTIQDIRKDIIGEIDAIIQYANHINASNNNLARAVWQDIMKEEEVHVGELFTVLAYLNPTTESNLKLGEKEVKDIMIKMGINLN